ncbi:MAG TPA: DUF1223 domain-containing protein [Puia sp.]|nr:DUF1223 domain-containing protein [Puia sp.]
MKILILAAAMAGLSIAASAVLKRDRWAAQTGLYGNGFAVVELFTSEGCSSCPPADALVARVQQEDKDLPVYILAFHVDYWDRLGWKDVYSDAAYTDRQKRYANWLKLSTIYTPEIVVNGRNEFVGSNEAALRDAIGNSLKEAAGSRVNLTQARLTGGRLQWRAQAETKEGAVDLVVAVVEHHATSQVKAGENHGRTLSHVQIVRALQTARPDAKGDAEGNLRWPQALGAADAEIVAFLQDRDSGKILAATRGMVAQ